MIMSSILMIHSIMRRLNVRIISSEISSIIHALERCQDGFVPDICTIAFQATETAKLLGRHEERGAHCMTRFWHIIIFIHVFLLKRKGKFHKITIVYLSNMGYIKNILGCKKLIN